MQSAHTALHIGKLRHLIIWICKTPASPGVKWLSASQWDVVNEGHQGAGSTCKLVSGDFGQGGPKGLLS